MARGISEFVSLLIVVTIAVVSVFIYTSFASGAVATASPKVRGLEVYVISREAVLTTTSTVRFSSKDYVPAVVYKVSFALVNSGTEPVTDIRYSVVSLNSSITVGSSRTSTVYDPVLFSSENGMFLPSSLRPGQVASFTLIVMARVDVASPRHASLVLRVSGRLPSGEAVEAQVPIFG